MKTWVFCIVSHCGRVLFMMLFICSAILAPVGLKAATCQWDADGTAPVDGGSGIWDGSSARWYDGSGYVAWPNDTGAAADTARFDSSTGTVTIAPGFTACVNSIYLTVPGYCFVGADSSSALAFSGAGCIVTGSVINAGASFSNMIIDTGSGVSFGQNGASTPFVFASGLTLTGTGRVNLVFMGGTYGAALYVKGPQSNFSGGFSAFNSNRRSADIYAEAAGSLGKGLASASGQARICCTFGAQAEGGAADGGRAGVIARNGGIVEVTGGTPTRDRFIIDVLGSLRGNAARLSQVTRVSGFTSHPGGAGPEAVFARWASVSHTDVSATSIASGGSAADILFGLGVNFNSGAFTLNIGEGTPWMGLAKDCQDVDTRLQKGTVAIAGSGTFTQMVIRSAGQPYGATHNIFYLGSGSDCPVFTALTSKVECRIVGTYHNGYDTGEVRLDSSAPAFRCGISRWTVGGDEAGGRLVTQRSGGFDGIPLLIDHNGYAQQYNSSSEVTGLSYRGAAVLSLDENGADTVLTAHSLAGLEHSVLFVAAGNSNANLGRVTSPWERLYVSSYPSGHVTNHAVFASQNGPNGSLSRPDLLDYDAATGFRMAAYDETTNINNLTEGMFAKFLTAQTVTADRACFGLVVGNAITCQGGGTDTYTLRLGRLAGGGQAPLAPFLCYEGAAQSCRPKLDFGNAEGIIYFRYGGTWSSDLDLYGSLQGANGMCLWGVEDANKWIYIRGANNAVTGRITVLQGYVEITSGNGFMPDNDVEVKRGGLLRLNVSDAWGRLVGLGPVEIAAGQTLTINQELSVDSCWKPRAIQGSGNLTIGSGARVTFDLDMASLQKDVPRLNMSTVSLTVQSGARIRIRSVANRAVLPSTYDESFVLIRHNGTLSGAFAGVDMPSDFSASREIKYDGTDIIVRFTSIRGTIFVVR